jgi:FAD synthase
MLEKYEQDIFGEEVEMDVIALCREFTEYDSLEKLIAAYDCIETEDDIADHTWFRKTAIDSYVVLNFNK